MPKTQAGLLEAMAGQQVTVDGVTRRLADPFLLLATENPIEYEGTFPLPEAQLDRFFLKTALCYPDFFFERKIVEEQLDGHPLARLRPATTVDEIAGLRHALQKVFVHEEIGRWIVTLVRATREIEMAAIGSSVRGTLALSHAARDRACLRLDAQRPPGPRLGRRELAAVPARRSDRRDRLGGLGSSLARPQRG